MLPRLHCDAPILCTPITADLLPKVPKFNAPAKRDAAASYAD